MKRNRIPNQEIELITWWIKKYNFIMKFKMKLTAKKHHEVEIIFKKKEKYN